MRLKSSIALVLLSALLIAPQASAHSRLIDITPGEAEVVGEGSFQATLTFNNPLLVVSGQPNAQLETKLAGENNWTAHKVSVLDRVLTARVVLSQPGKYDLRWSVVSSDGHQASGKSDFILDIEAPVDGPGQSDPNLTAPQPTPVDSEGSLIGFYIGLSMVLMGVVFAPIGLIIRRRAKKFEA